MKDALDAAPDAASLAERTPPRRVLVSSYRSAPHVGGQGVYVRELSRALAEAGCEVSVASGPPWPDLVPGVELIKLPSLDLFAEDNAFLALRWRHLRSRADRGEWLAHNTGAFGEMTAFARRLDEFLRREGDRFDVVHDNQTLAPGMVEISRRMPVITTLHHPIAIDRDFAVAGADRWWKRLLTQRWHDFVDTQAATARRLPRFLSVSEAARRGYAERCGVDPAKIAVAHNGIDHDSFRPDPATPREADHLVALASADVPIKGLDVIVSALALVAPDRPDLRLTVIGALREGPTKRMLERTGLVDRVAFVSGLSREAVADLYRRATVFVSASRFEGFGFPAAEAMACGAPVIVSDGGALPEVAGDAGLVTPVGDAPALADAMTRVLDDPALQARMSEAGARRARDAFRWRDHAAAAMALYDAALEETAHA
ncbi:glycosyltransferase family 1 protein [Marinicauda salina]|uniref:Glycosyltransferase family 1 protein n=1 Tax=Marinicauda salina TaxID=2135793 RepID=A0A2U2BSU6_9PROT|nr:glycosyltransferase family 4 protein [Marinicauda salina]PWE17066.1 glycosyltransferase family 1 protein [Marinicauda salina]